MYRVMVHGPNVGPWGSDAYLLESPAALEETDQGSLVIKHRVIDGPRDIDREETTIYPRGEWIKVRFWKAEA